MNSDGIDRNTLTPMLRQYYTLKAEAEDAVLFFRMGDFYELFGKDAEIVAPILQLVLTSRERGDKNKIAFCGVPHHSAKNYYMKLLKKGYRIAIADQIGDPAESKGLVERKIVARLSPGCVDDLDALESDSPNYILAVHQKPSHSKWGILLADISTAELCIGEVDSLEEVVSVVRKFRPKELWSRQFFQTQIKVALKEFLAQESLLFGVLPEGILRDEAGQLTILKSVFSTVPKLVAKVESGKELLAATLSHIASMGFSSTRFLGVQSLQPTDKMELSENVVRDLELFETQMRRERRGSLASVIDHTMSAMGSRTLRHQLTSPLLNYDEIQNRHAYVAAVAGLGTEKLHSLRQLMQGLPDVRRLLTRVMTGKVTADEIWLLGSACEKIAKFVRLLSGNNALKMHPFTIKMDSLIGSFEKISQEIDLAFGLEQSLNRESRTFFRGGFDKALDDIVFQLNNGQELIDSYVATERQKTGINSLKVRKHKSFGLLLDVTKTHAKKVPEYFIRRQTMVNGERFSTGELALLSEQLEGALQHCSDRQTELFRDLTAKIGFEYKDASLAAEHFGFIDMMVSFGWLALKENWVQPQLSKDGTLNLKNSRHPVVEQFIGKHNFTPNDVFLSPQFKNILITGPNMAGKSTVMRQVALTALLNQIGCFVPAFEATLPVFDNIFTRVGASDNLIAGQSTFMVEMSEAAHILRSATAQSLVVLDEIGRGTSTQDGLAIASAIFAALAERVGSYTLFATHYHELVAFSSRFSNVNIYQTLVSEKDNRIDFSHRLVPGASGHSYGIEVAKLAGIPAPVIEEAKKFLLETHSFANSIHAAPLIDATEVRAADDFRPLEPSFGFDSNSVSLSDMKIREIIERLELIKIHKTTPLQALTILNDLKNELVGEARQTEFNFYPEPHA